MSAGTLSVIAEDFVDCHSPSRRMPGWNLKPDHDIFLQHPSRFVFHYPSYRSTLYNLNKWQHRLTNHTQALTLWDANKRLICEQKQSFGCQIFWSRLQLTSWTFCLPYRTHSNNNTWRRLCYGAPVDISLRTFRTWNWWRWLINGKKTSPCSAKLSALMINLDWLFQ
jgi:hypothetical protein